MVAASYAYKNTALLWKLRAQSFLSRSPLLLLTSPAIIFRFSVTSVMCSTLLLGLGYAACRFADLLLLPILVLKSQPLSVGRILRYVNDLSKRVEAAEVSWIETPIAFVYRAFLRAFEMSAAEVRLHMEKNIAELSNQLLALEMKRDRGIRDDALQQVLLRTPCGVDFYALLIEPVGRLRGAVLYIGGNGENASDSVRFLRSSFSSRGFLVCAFDERGCGINSKDEVPTRNGMVVDAATVLAYLIAPVAEGGRGIDRKLVLVLGHSLGGSLAMIAAAAAGPVGLVVSDRSFSTLADTAAEVVVSFAERLEEEGKVNSSAASYIVNLIATNPRARWFVKLFVRCFVRNLGNWDLDSVSALRIVTQQHLTRTLCMWTPHDDVIPRDASLALALPKPSEAVELSDFRSGSEHNRAMTSAEIDFIVAKLLSDEA